MRNHVFAFVLVTSAFGVLDGRNCPGKPTVFGQRDMDIRCLDQGIYIGGAPKSDADFRQLRRLGVRHVIDVRSFKVLASAAERRRAAKHGCSYQRIPTGFRPAERGTVPQIMAVLAASRCGAVYVHCNLGSDRMGMIEAIYRTERLGWDPETAFAAWKSDQFNPRLKQLDQYFWQHVACLRPDVSSR